MSGHSRDVACPVCGKVMAARGLGSHQRQRHGGPQLGLAAMPNAVPAARAPAARSKRVSFVVLSQLYPDLEIPGWFTLPTSVQGHQSATHTEQVRITSGKLVGQVFWARQEDCHGIDYIDIVEE